LSSKHNFSLGRAKSFQLVQQLPRVSQNGLNPLSLGDCISGEQAVLARVLVSPWRAGFWRTAAHAAAPFAAHKRSLAVGEPVQLRLWVKVFCLQSRR
jgi:hypothetical protein